MRPDVPAERPYCLPLYAFPPGHGCCWQGDKWSISPFTSYIDWDADLTNYYYEVTRSESEASRDARPSYHPDVAMFVQVKGGLLLEASVGTQRYDFFPLLETDSPEDR